MIPLNKADKIRKEIERNFKELIKESRKCLLCFAAKLKSSPYFPYCLLHVEAFAYQLRVKLAKDYQNTLKALIDIQENSGKLNRLVEYIIDEPKLQYIFIKECNKLKGWKLRASYERVKKKEYPKLG